MTSTAKPREIRPMLAKLAEQPFDRPGWIFEPKWDGYRALAEVGPDGVRLYSRNHKTFEHRFALVVESLRELGHDAVLDGEVVVLDRAGRSRFQLLQNYQKTGEGQLVYYVFDLLWLDGKDLRRLPLRRRKQLLARMLPKLPHVRLGEHVEGQGTEFFKAATVQGLEGIIAKDGSSPYREGVRSGEWLKIKTKQRQEAVIAGFTEPRGSRKALGALVLGVYERGRLVYIGHTGGGFDTRGLQEMRARLEPLEQKRCPFAVRPGTNAPVHWVKPVLVCEVKFQEWTVDGQMRQPIFVGLREDKPASEVQRERAAAAPEPKLTNLDKVYWPKEHITKGDLVDYYRAVAPVILPYLRDRPLSLLRHPNGITGHSFFQKDVSGQPPPTWVQTAPIRSESGDGTRRYIVCQDEATLLYVANLGCIELNPWHSRLETLERPDYLMLDLDPEDADFRTVVQTALAVRKLLDQLGAASYCKTSGKRGLHICVPLAAAYDYDQARQFAELAARLVNEQLPETTSVLRSPRLRQKRVYLDYLQNRRAQTLAAAYSVRPVPGATVSTPLRWSEVNARLDPLKFTMRTMLKRLDKVGDLWAPVAGRGVDLQACLKHLARLPAT